MTIFGPWIPSAGSIVQLATPMPTAAAETRRFVAERNAEARRAREASDRAHADRMAQLREFDRQARAAVPAHRPAAATLNVAEYYRRVRNELTTDERSKLEEARDRINDVLTEPATDATTAPPASAGRRITARDYYRQRRAHARERSPMSATTTAPTTPATPIPLCASLLRLFAALGRGPGDLLLHGRSLDFGIPWQQFVFLREDPPSPLSALPTTLLDKLEDRGRWALTISASTWAPDRPRPIRLGALYAGLDLAPTISAQGWRFDEARAAAAVEALDGFPIAPAIVIDGFSKLLALWPLAEAISADDTARALLHRLAERLGADVLDDPLTAHLPLPGGIVRDFGNVTPPRVGFVACDEHPVTTLDAMQRALNARSKGARA